METLAAAGLVIDRVREIPRQGLAIALSATRAELRADREIPLLLGIRGVKR